MALSSASGRVECSPDRMKKNLAKFLAMQVAECREHIYGTSGPATFFTGELAVETFQGLQDKTRTLISRKPRDRGKQPLGRLLIAYAPGQMVKIMINPAVQKGMPHRRYHGRVGTIAEKRGRSYVVEVTGTKTPRIIIARPEHITSIEESS